MASIRIVKTPERSAVLPFPVFPSFGGARGRCSQTLIAEQILRFGVQPSRVSVDDLDVSGVTFRPQSLLFGSVDGQWMNFC
jgi:hypothetical protein